jgi:phosphoglycerol transferase MdoB-like AlkP superfamily enzyme
MPISRFHIPAMFLGGSIQPDNVETVASQIDLLPTALSLLGMEALSPSLGRDLTRSEQRYQPGRAIMQYHSTNAYMDGDQVVIFQRGKEAQQYTWVQNELRPNEILDAELHATALAHTLWPQLAYPSGNYRLPAMKN